MKNRRFWRAFSLVVLVVGITLLFTLLARSDRLGQMLRVKLISLILKSTGARAEIGDLKLSLAALDIRLDKVVIHGRESAEEPPLFAADSVTVHLGVISLLHRNWYVDSVSILRPRHYLAIRADGSTNLPTPHRQDPASLLLNLHVHHLRMQDGLARVNFQEARYDLTESSVRVSININQAGTGYLLQTVTGGVDISSVQRGTSYRLNTLSVTGELQPDKLSLTHLTAQSPIGVLHASGVLSDFANPRLFAHTWGIIDVRQLTSLVALKGTYAGDLHFVGIVQKQASAPYTLEGKLSGTELAVHSGPYRMQHASLTSLIKANDLGISFSHLALSAIGAALNGHGRLTREGLLESEGDFHGLVVNRLQKMFSHSGPTIASVAAGRVRLYGVLGPHGRGLTLAGQSTFTPLAGPLPLNGSVDAAVLLGSRQVDISDAHFTLAGTQMSVKGRVPDAVNVLLDSPDLSTLRPLIERVPAFKEAWGTIPMAGSLHLEGSISKLLADPEFDGAVQATNLQFQGQQLTSVQTHLHLQPDSVRIDTATVRTSDFVASAKGNARLSRYRPTRTSGLQLQVHVSQANVAKLFQQYGGVNLPIIQGIGSASFTLAGSTQDPRGNGTVSIDSLNAYGQLLNQVRLALQIEGRTLEVNDGRIEAGPALLAFSGAYTRSTDKWTNGQLVLQVRSDGFPLASLSPVRRFAPDVDADLEANARLETGINEHGLSPSQLQGFLHIRHVAFKHFNYGDLLFDTKTQGSAVSTRISGDLAGRSIAGSVRTDLSESFQTTADVEFGEIRLSDIQRVTAVQIPGLNAEGFLRGVFHAEGPLSNLSRFTERLQVDQLQLRTSTPQTANTGVLAAPSPSLVFENQGPLILSAANGTAQVSSFHIVGPETDVTMTGRLGWRPSAALDLDMEGAVNLAILQQWRAGVQSTGSLKISAHANGTWDDPEITGRAVIENGKILAANLANGLTDVNGTVRFDGTRARIEKLQAKSGGGQINVSGSVTYETGAPLVYNLQAEARDTRFRYANAISVTGNATLRLTGTSQNGLLSGGVTINRAVLNTDADLGNILASTAAPVPVAQNQRDLLTGLQMDVHIDSSDDLVLSTALSQNVQTDIDLHLRGAPDRPVLLGTITANQGDIKLFGAKYTINRGVVNFVNAVKLEPVLDLDLQTETRGIAVDITVSGTPSKLNLNYRSDPPLQPKDIIALLTVGQAPSFTTASVGNAQVTNDNSALQAGANTLLGQAASPVSNRLSKLFGITNIKIDPLVQGITNTPQARLTLEQQISRDITVTYITNLAETSEQIFRFEWALTPQYSVIAIRDDNGEFGIDVQYRKRFGSH